jgi:glycosyltransferase involved in cell wall biosynthesis
VGPVAGQAKTRLLAEADVFVLPSHEEGQPWAVLEAMCAALPVVATDVGAMTDMVRDGVNGFIVRVGDSEEIASCILRLTSDGDLRKAMGDMSKRIMEEHFTARRFVEGMTGVFVDVLAERVRA